MHAEYQSALGRFRLYDGGSIVYECFGYSGFGAGVNNPVAESVPSVGPIPRATWRIGPAYTHPRLGALTFPLTLKRGVIFGRSAFRIHGDNRKRNRSASTGCIILDRRHREQLNKIMLRQQSMLLFVHTDDEELERAVGLDPVQENREAAPPQEASENEVLLHTSNRQV